MSERNRGRSAAPIVDFHAYFQPGSFLERLRKRRDYPRIENAPTGEVILSGPGVARPLRPEQTDIEWRVQALSASGIDCQVLRLQNVSGVDALEPAEGLEVARGANEELASIAARFPGRFVCYAAVPMADVPAAIAELERAVAKLGHRGVGISASFAGKGLDHPEFVPLLECAAALDVPVLLLPNHPSMIDGLLRPHGWLTGAYGFQVDISTVALRLACNGTLERLPGLRVVLANLGGVLPFLVERLDEYRARMHAGARPLKVPPKEALRRFWYETASGHPAAIRMTAETIGVDRLLFGSDYPSFDFVRALENVRHCGLPEEDVERILRGNAAALIDKVSSSS
jgi:predicted TIM-barrel fold metal-dependent hydrolase